MPFKWVPNAAETLTVSHDGYFGFCPAKSQLYRVVVKPPRQRLRLRTSCSWQMPGDRLIDDPRPEDGTDFSSYATAAFADILGCDCWRVVVARHAYHPGAGADRSQRQTVVRVLRALPRRPDAAGDDHPDCPGTDRPGSGAACQNNRLRAHLFDRKRPRSGSGTRRQSRPEGHPGNMARQ